MAHITVDINDQWLREVQECLDAANASEAINEAMRIVLDRRDQAKEFVAEMKSLDFDATARGAGWRYGGGRKWAAQDMASGATEEDAA